MVGACGVRGLEDADLAVAFEVEEADEGFGLGDAQVVAGEEAEPAAPGEELAEVGLEAQEPARHDEANGDVSSCRLGQLSAQVGEEGVVLASRDEAGGCCWAGGEVVALARGDVAGAAAGSGTSPR